MTEANTPDGKSNRFRWFTAAVIVLMIALMVFSSNTVSRQSRMAHGVLVGTSNSGDVMSNDTHYATMLLEQLSTVFIAVPTGSPGQPPQLEPLLGACWGDAIYRDLKSHPEALFLALREARRISPGVSPYAIGPVDPEQQQPEADGIFNSGNVDVDTLHPLPSSPLGAFRARVGRGFPIELRVVGHTKDNHTTQVLPNTLPPLEQEALYSALHDFLTLQAASSLPLNAIKPTTPMLDRMLAQRFQAFTLEMAAVDARPLVAQVPEPTEQQLSDQLTKYAAFIPSRATADNPFGFGYRVPDRVKLELISFKRADVRHVVEAEKTPYEWEVAARIAYASDPAIVKPTPQPTTQTTTAPSAAAPAFEAVKDQAIAGTIDRATDARALEVEKALRAPMMLDYQQWANATTTRPGATTLPAGTVAKSSLDAPYNSPDYLSKLAQLVQKKFKVLPTVELYTDRFRDAAALQLLGGFNEATRPLPPDLVRRTGRRAEVITGPEYAINFAKDLLDAPMLETLGGLVLERYRPSERLELNRDDGRDREVFYFRIAEAERNHPGTEIDPIREQLKFDWRLAEAQKLAVAKASAVVDAATKAGGDLAAAVAQALPGAQVIHADVGPFHSAPEANNALGLSMPAYAQFGTQVVDKLLADAAGIATLDVPLAGKAYAAKRLAVRGDWSSEEDIRMMRQELRRQFAIQMAQPASDTNAFGVTEQDTAATWIDSKSVFARFAYKAARDDSKD